MDGEVLNMIEGRMVKEESACLIWSRLSSMETVNSVAIDLCMSTDRYTNSVVQQMNLQFKTWYHTS